jgi:hypothetical protein
VERSKLGNRYTRMPSRYRIAARRHACKSSRLRGTPPAMRLASEKVSDTPTIHMKDGNTVSVGVQPFHLACRSGAYACDPSPGLFTNTISAIVAPRKASRDTSLCPLLTPEVCSGVAARLLTGYIVCALASAMGSKCFNRGIHPKYRNFEEGCRCIPPRGRWTRRRSPLSS